MNFTIERAALIEALAPAAAVAPAGGIAPIVSHALIETTRQGIQVRATDVDTTVAIRAAAEVAQPGATTALAASLHDAARRFEEGAQIRIEAIDDGARVRLRSGRTVYTFGALPPADFPPVKARAWDAEFSVPAADLKRHLQLPSVATLKDTKDRWWLNGVHIRLAEGDHGPVLRAEASDGHRAVQHDLQLPDGARALPLQNASDPDSRRGVLIPGSSITQMIKLLGDVEGEVTVRACNAAVEIEAGALTFSTKLFDAQFPDLDRVWPKEDGRLVIFKASDLRGLLDRLSVFDGGRDRLVRFSFGKNKASAACRDDDTNHGETEMECQCDGGFEIDFNRRYLSAALDPLGSAETRMIITDARSAVRVLADDLPQLRQLVMPVM